MKKSAAALAAALAALTLGLLSGSALAGDHHGDHGHHAKPAKPAKPPKPEKPESSPSQSGQNPEPKVYICHATGSATNPYVLIHVSSHALPAHTRHQDGRDIVLGDKPGPCPTASSSGVKAAEKTQQQVTFCDMSSATTGDLETKNAAEVAKHEFDGNPEENRDIVPPFTLDGKTYSENWDANGQAIFAAHCNEQQKPQSPPKPTPPPKSQQMVSFCDMDTATTGQFQTKNAVDLLNHEFDGNPEETRDIVPPFTFSGPTFTTKDGRTYVAGQTYSQLWSGNSPAIFAAHCNLTTSSTAPPSTPAPAAPAPAAPAPPASSPAATAPAATSPAPTAPAATSGVKGASKTIVAPASHRPSHGVLGVAKTLGSSATSGTLPFTGLRLWIVELVALGLIGGGVAMRLIARRRLNS